MGNEGNRGKLALLGISGLMLVVVGTVVTVNVTKNDSSGTSSNGDVSASMKAIDAMCGPTDYKEACVKTLESSGTNTTDPAELIRAMVKATKKYIHDASSKSVTLKELEKDPMGKQALNLCSRLMEYSLDELSVSFQRLGEIDISKIDEASRDLNVWLSAVGTYQETCMDGFTNVTSDAGAKMREALNMSRELTSNAIAMVTEFSSIITNLTLDEDVTTKRRRLLHAVTKDQSLPSSVPTAQPGDLPDWIDPMKRKLLAARLKADLVVAQDGSGKYKTIKEALKDIPKNSLTPFVLHVKAGIYKETVTFDRTMTNLVLVGDGPTKTKITFDKSYAKGINTWDTSTVIVLGNDFMAKDIGFENSAGPAGLQAVALLVKSDKAVFYNCRMDGYQDTLYVPGLTQFYRDCIITGTIDFIFGDAASIFQNCQILIRRPLANQQCAVTAQGRTDKRSATAIILQGCKVTGDPTYTPVQAQFDSYLGRPWKVFSKTIVMQSFIDNVIRPEGWYRWEKDMHLDTLHYGEYQNTGPGAGTLQRVKWKGIKPISPKEAMSYTPRLYFKEDTWITKWGIPYKPGMV